jgi:acyl-CoA thioester hydrolase
MKPQALPRSAYGFHHRITTRWADNDVYGHVNNALYYSFFDTTITAYLLQSQALRAADGDVRIYVVASDCAYFKAFSFPEVVESGLAVAAVGRTSVTWRIGLFGEGESQPRAQGRFVHVCIDRDSQTPRDWPDVWKEAFDRLTPPV